MSVIPKRIYRLVEKRLREREGMITRAEMRLYEAQAAAVSSAAPPTDSGAAFTGTPGNRTMNGALSILEAEEKLRDARQWEEVFSLVRKAFPTPETVEGKMAAYLYDQGKTQAQACAFFGCDRQTVRRARDTYVCHCALIAAGMGLIKITEEENDQPGSH